MQDDSFNKALDQQKLKAWEAIRGVIEGVLSGNRDSLNFERLVNSMMESFKVLDVNMSLKIHILHFHLDILQAQRSTESEEHGERQHQVQLPFEAR